MMILTARDRAILKHIEEYEFATIKQIADMFFKEQKYGYDIARKRLNAMVRDNHLLATRDYKTGLNLYSIDKIKNITMSKVLLMDFYSRLIAEGCEILFFEKEYSKFMSGKIRPDGFTVIKFNGYVYYYFIEVQTRHANPDIQKYETLYYTNEFQNTFQTKAFPTIIVIDDIDHKKQLGSDLFKVIQLNFIFDGFPKIFL